MNRTFKNLTYPIKLNLLLWLKIFEIKNIFVKNSK